MPPLQQCEWVLCRGRGPLVRGLPGALPAGLAGLAKPLVTQEKGVDGARATVTAPVGRAVALLATPPSGALFLWTPHPLGAWKAAGSSLPFPAA